MKAILFAVSLCTCSLFARSQKVNLHLVEDNNIVYKTSCLKDSVQTVTELYKKQQIHKGYWAFSIDTIICNENICTAQVYTGILYKQLQITIPAEIGNRFPNLFPKNEVSLQPSQLDSLYNVYLRYFETHGLPFAKLQLQNTTWNENTILASLQVEGINLNYFIDSVHVVDEEVNVDRQFLQKHIGLFKKTAYNPNWLLIAEKKINELPYLQITKKPELVLLSTGSYINLNIKNRNANKANALLGLIPQTQANGSTKYSVIGEAMATLYSFTGKGEYLHLNFQQLLPKSPRLLVQFALPFIGNTRLPLEANFQLYKRDSLFLNLEAAIQTGLAINTNYQLRFGFLWQQTNTITVNLAQVQATKQLPSQLDTRMASFVAQLRGSNITNAFFPMRGGQVQASLHGGGRTVRLNNDILKLQDPLNPNFNYKTLYDTVSQRNAQIRWNAQAATFKRITKGSVLKLALNTGLISGKQLFFNELFLLGGIKSLRGFNEETIPASQYAIGTAEYRIAAGNNAYLFALLDGAIMQQQFNTKKNNVSAGGIGAGIVINSKTGLLNITIANGRLQGTNAIGKGFKMHLGYQLNF
jgi:hypothetical protein